MFYREARSLSTRYAVEVVVAGQLKREIFKDGIRVTTYRKRSKAGHLGLLLEMYIHLRSVRYDVIHCFDFDSLMVAVLVSRFLSQRPVIVYDAHEHTPSLIAGYFRLPKVLSSILEHTVDVLERFYANYCDAFIVVNDSLRERFSGLGAPVVTVRNFASLSWYDEAPGHNFLDDISDPIIIYVGATLDAHSRGIDKTIQAKTILDKRGIKTCFVLVGNVQETSLYPRLAAAGFRLTGLVAYTALPSLLRRAKVGLALLQPTSFNNMIGQPNKLFAYMVAGLPIVASNLPGMREIISKENCGLLVNPDDPEETAKAIATLLRDEKTRLLMGKKGRLAAEREYNWEMESGRLTHLYEQIEASIRQSDQES
jgi:glycosyltransferase involved in cell wall biosynthesis